VLRRLACGSPLDELKIPFCVCRSDLLFRMRVNPGSVATQNVKKQQLCG
jgi:hypothetical protein